MFTATAYCLISLYFSDYPFLFRFLPRDAMHKRGLCRHAVSVCVSVCPSRSWILSKRINISPNCFNRRVAKPFQFFHTKRHGNIPTETSLTGTSNAGGVGTNRDHRRYSWLSIDYVLDLRTTTATIPSAVYRTDGEASVKLSCSMHDHDEEKRT